MKNYTNKIYARLNEKGVVIKLFSSVFEQALESDVLVEEGNAEYHAHVHLKYNLMDVDGRYNYIVRDGKMVQLTDEEKEELFPKEEIIPEPTLEEKYAELEACVLELAEIVGGNA